MMCSGKFFPAFPVVDSVVFLVAEFPGPNKVNLCIVIVLYIPQKVEGYLPSY